jgi:LytS/YehU family sensor histidine kinase
VLKKNPANGWGRLALGWRAASFGVVSIVSVVVVVLFARNALPLFVSLLACAALSGLAALATAKVLQRHVFQKHEFDTLDWRHVLAEGVSCMIVTLCLCGLSFGLWRAYEPQSTIVAAGLMPYAVIHVLFVAAIYLVPRTVVEQQRSHERHLAKRSAEKLRIATLERSVVVSELKTLQAQIEPHFLYNVLANVQSMIAHTPATADAMLTHLIDYLKHALPSMRGGESTLRAELDLVCSFLAIARLRFGDRMSVSITEANDADAASIAMPPMLLLPLVENAVKHGVEGKAGAVRVDIDVKLEENMLTINVNDNGPGFKQTSGSGIGIANVRERLAALFQEDAFVNVAPREGGGVVSTLCIPIIKKYAV